MIHLLRFTAEQTGKSGFWLTLEPLKAKSKCNPFLDEIKQRIGDGQERGLAAPDGLNIDEIYKERVPLYNKWADITLNGDKSIEDLISKIISLI